MTGFDQIAWLPLCAGLTVLGLIASWLVGRRRGWGAGLRGVAWSLLPVAAYLLGIIELLWSIAGAAVRWVAGFVFSPFAWGGVALVGVAAVLFVVSGVIRRRARPKPSKGTKEAASKAETAAINTKPEKQSAASQSTASNDENFDEVEEILRRRGIQ